MTAGLPHGPNQQDGLISEQHRSWHAATPDRDATSRHAQLRISTVTLDMGDAIELSELLDYLAQWLGLADDTVRADLAAFALDHGAIRSVREHLVSFARLLVFGSAPLEPDLDDDQPDELDRPDELDQTCLGDDMGTDVLW